VFGSPAPDAAVSGFVCPECLEGGRAARECGFASASALSAHFERAHAQVAVAPAPPAPAPQWGGTPPRRKGSFGDGDGGGGEAGVGGGTAHVPAGVWAAGRGKRTADGVVWRAEASAPFLLAWGKGGILLRQVTGGQ
jgi:hypothetical protein